MKERPDFFVSAAGEVTGDLATPRACWVKGRMRDDVRDDHMLIEIAPPIIGQAYGLGGQDITKLVLSARYQDDTLFPIKEWPCHVYVARIIDESLTNTLTFTKGHVEVIAWGMIFHAIEDAKAQTKEPINHAT